jgi:hypothetical protein
MNPETPTPVHGELRARKERALGLLLIGTMLFIFSPMVNPGVGFSPPPVVDAHGNFVRDARGEIVRRPTLGYYIGIALLPWNLALGAGAGFMVAAAVVRFRRPTTAPSALDAGERQSPLAAAE